MVDLFPNPKGDSSIWEINLMSVVTWSDLYKNGECLQKIHEEGWGRAPVPMAEVCVHWRVFGPDAKLIHSTRYTIDLSDTSKTGMQQVEDEDKPAPCYVFGENLWDPLGVLCQSLRQGGVGEIRL